MSSPYDDSFDSVLADLDFSVGTTDATTNKKPKLSEIAQQAQLISAYASASSSNSNALQKTTVKKQSAVQSNTIAVNSKQRGNPILKSITNIPWEFCEDIVPDYIVGATSCVLYLSLKYHNLNPDYINNRLKELGKMYELRILLVQVDIKVSSNSIATKCNLVSKLSGNFVLGTT